MLGLVIAHHDDLARGVREPAEPAADRVVRPPQRILCRCPDLVARREPQGRVVPQPGQRCRHAGRAEDLGAEPGELAVDALGLLEPDRVDRLRREVERRVGPDEMRVGRVAAGDVAEPGPVVRAGDRPQLVDEDRSLSLERRPDPSADRGEHAVGEGRSCFERPVRVVSLGRARPTANRRRRAQGGRPARRPRCRRGRPAAIRPSAAATRRPSTWRSIQGPMARQRSIAALASSGVSSGW